MSLRVGVRPWKGRIQRTELRRGKLPGCSAPGRGPAEEVFAAYHDALELWSAIFAEDPKLAGIPQSLLDQANAGDEQAQKTVDRLKRNYAFDRARVFIPAAATTNQMLKMSARGWVELVQKLYATGWEEARQLAGYIVEELKLAVPRLVKHAVERPNLTRRFTAEFSRAVRSAHNFPAVCLTHPELADLEREYTLRVTPPHSPDWDYWDTLFADDLEFHDNRYEPVGTNLQRTQVLMTTNGIDFASLRDLNRHRTGHKHTPLVPQAFYSATDQLPEWVDPQIRARLEELAAVGRQITHHCHQLLASGDRTYIYWILLGTEFEFEHGTTADKFIYEAELRTGPGVHYSYCNAYRAWLRLWYDQYPSTLGKILEGSAEPE